MMTLRTNIAPKCEMFMNCCKNVISILKKEKKNNAKDGVLNRCEGTDRAYKCKQCEAVNLTLYGHKYFV